MTTLETAVAMVGVKLGLLTRKDLPTQNEVERASAQYVKVYGDVTFDSLVREIESRIQITI